jgi:hypothetical protein
MKGDLEYFLFGGVGFNIMDYKFLHSQQILMYAQQMLRRHSHDLISIYFISIFLFLAFNYINTYQIIYECMNLNLKYLNYRNLPIIQISIMFYTEIINKILLFSNIKLIFIYYFYLKYQFLFWIFLFL